MSTGPTPAFAPAPTPAATLPKSIRIVSHSTLFYWWPIWGLCFILAFITWLGGERLATVPKNTKAESSRNVEGHTGPRDVLIVPQDAHLLLDAKGELVQPHVRISGNKNLGVIFVIFFLLVVFITNVPLRGLWSVIALGLIVFLSIIFALLDWWDKIMFGLGLLDIRINLAGYMTIGLALFTLWILVIFLFDRQIYMVFTPGQLRVRLEIGDAETAYDTAGMTFQKERTNLFLHWVLGLGSGDLIIKTSGATPHQFHMYNVLFVNRKVKEIEEMIKTKVTTGSP